MGVQSALQHCLLEYEFERGFIEVLGWSRFRHSSQVELPDVGRLPSGWQTRETRAQLVAAARLPFSVRGIAALTPQVVLHCTSQTGQYIDSLQRERLTRELAKLFYQPIIIYTSVQLKCQDWHFPTREGPSVSMVKFSADGKDATETLASALCRLEVTVQNISALGEHLEVLSRVAAIRDELAHSLERDDPLRFAMKFAKFGERIVSEAKHAFERRVWELPRQIEIARQAKSGDLGAQRRFFEMHQYLVFERVREYLKNKHAFVSEFDDYIGAGNLGIARGLARYDPSKPYAPSTLLFFHIDKHISRAFGLLELPMWIPTHVQADLLRACWREKTAFDVLAQQAGREPTDLEVLESLGLDEEDIDVYNRFKQSRLWNNRISLDDLDEDVHEHCTSYREAFDRRENLKQLEAYVRLQSLPDRHREALALRTGLHPAAQAEPLTLEEVSQVLCTTRERARQLLIRAAEKARTIEIEPIDLPIHRPTLRSAAKKPRVPPAAQPARAYPVQPRRPPRGFMSANHFVNYALESGPIDPDPYEIHRAMLRIFPSSSLKVERIIRKIEVLSQERKGRGGR